tara:strand:+ start:2323 stop:2763 length:441 start_codon:yes stop_codon:yes gene_type:complete
MTWPVGATEFSIDASAVIPSGGVSQSNPDSLSSPTFGGLANVSSSSYFQWNQINAAGLPVSTDISELPLAFYAANTAYGIYDFGLLDCNASPTCANAVRSAKINKTDQPNDKIHFYIELRVDDSQAAKSTSAIGGTFDLLFSGRWH